MKFIQWRIAQFLGIISLFLTNKLMTYPVKLIWPKGYSKELAIWAPDFLWENWTLKRRIVTFLKYLLWKIDR